MAGHGLAFLFWCCDSCVSSDFRSSTRPMIQLCLECALPHRVWHVWLESWKKTWSHFLPCLLLFWSWYGAVVSWHILTLFICWLYLYVIFRPFQGTNGSGSNPAAMEHCGLILTEQASTMRTRANQTQVEDKSKTSRWTVWRLTSAHRNHSAWFRKDLKSRSQAGWLIWTQRISQLDIATGQGSWFEIPSSKTAEHGYVIDITI